MASGTGEGDMRTKEGVCWEYRRGGNERRVRTDAIFTEGIFNVGQNLEAAFFHTVLSLFRSGLCQGGVPEMLGLYI